MQRTKLTKRIVDQQSAQHEERILWDSELRGFGLKIQPTGRKVFILFYRTKAGRQRRPVIGAYGAITVDQARDIAREWLADVARGGDPSGSRQMKRKAATVKDLGERYLKEHAEIHKKASSQKEDRRLLQREICPRLGQLKIESVQRADVIRLHQALVNSPYTGNRCVSLLSKMFNLAELWGLRPDGSNPCRHVKKYRERMRERFLSEAELNRVGLVLDEMANGDALATTAVNVIRTLALTGCRLGEILSLQWDWVNFAAGTLDFPDSKTGAKRIPLGNAALALLASISRSGCAWVFPNRDNSMHIPRARLEDVWKQVRVKAKLENARLHDFRHTVGTYSGQAGHNAFIVRDLLGHKDLSMTSRYVNKDFRPLRDAANAVSEKIAGALSNTTMSGSPARDLVAKGHDEQASG